MIAPIAAIDTWIVRYPVRSSFKFFRAFGGHGATRDTVLVRVTDTEGRFGWGQSVPSHTWSYETVETAQSTIDRYLGPALIGKDALDFDDVWRTMNRVIAASNSTGQPIAKAGIDLALHDLAGVVRQRSWGGVTGKSITLSWTIDPGGDLTQVGATIGEAHERGYANFNVKTGLDAVFDLEVCREIRRLLPSAFVWVDANGGYDLDTALAIAPRLADLGIAALEQPLPANRLTGYQRLRTQGALPILMDEGIVALTDLQEFHRLGCLDGVAMKVSRSGGITEARRMIHYLREHGLQYFASGLTDPDVALSACLHLFAATDLPHPAALNAPQFLEGSILRQPLPIVGDQASVPPGFGLGVEVDLAHPFLTQDTSAFGAL
jgi:L-alanine-DL-glutamate epimerase-like enolase superfamily enzyme